MAIRHNILANYASQIYVAVIGIVVVPVLIRFLGPESYGLVGFYAMIQAWFNLLDMGMSPSVSRETARYQGGASTAMRYRSLVRALEFLFLLFAISGGAALFLGAGTIAERWLNFQELPLRDVVYSLQIMALIVALRWSCGLYRGVIIGSQRQVWLSVFNIVIATLRFVVVLLVLMIVGATPSVFFTYQLCIALIELAFLAGFAYRMLPYMHAGERIKWEWAPLRPVLWFSLTIAFTSFVWVMVTQVDKLILSGLLNLDEYGYFTLSVLAASTIMLLSSPVGQALMPRLSQLEAEGRHGTLVQVYRTGTQLVAILSGSAAITLACMAEPLLLAWSGDAKLTAFAAPVLTLYAIGNGFLAVAAFPYYLQYAKGDLKLHLIGNLIFVVLLVPAIIWAAKTHGAIGAGWVWLGMNALSFMIWLPLVHAKFAPGLNARWYTVDTLALLVPACAAGFTLSRLVPQDLSRLTLCFATAGVGLGVVLVAVAVHIAIKRLAKEPILDWGGKDAR
jgi:O-antigen/teichoic acid export membrane protein